MMRDFMGSHVSQVDDYGQRQDVDDVFVSTCVRGSFVVKFADHIGKLVVRVEPQDSSGIAMQLTLDQATLLRDLLDAGIADMQAAGVVDVAPLLELPASGDAA
ncbi:hypothetical protein [Nocardia nova]|uniref:hypothetical protein n=1 Tax=Nocardia nova TaxID=37330 RepID=UPI0033EC8DF6